jgi:anti-sigma factor RsiW
MPSAYEAPGQHPSDHDIDLFVMKRLPPKEREGVRQHLLDCDACCLEVVKTADFIDALREALRDEQPRLV